LVALCKIDQTGGARPPFGITRQCARSGHWVIGTAGSGTALVSIAEMTHSANRLKAYGGDSFGWCPNGDAGFTSLWHTRSGGHRTRNGCTLIEYQGSDGNTYHEFIGLFGTVWFVTYRYVIDHVEAVKAQGADTPRNMHWQTKSAAKAKDPLGIVALAHRLSLTVSFFGIPTGRNR